MCVDSFLAHRSVSVDFYIRESLTFVKWEGEKAVNEGLVLIRLRGTGGFLSWVRLWKTPESRSLLRVLRFTVFQ